MIVVIFPETTIIISKIWENDEAETDGPNSAKRVISSRAGEPSRPGAPAGEAGWKNKLAGFWRPTGPGLCWENGSAGAQYEAVGGATLFEA